MSTFKGVVDEFPDIRIDYFRQIPGKTPPLACFLSHVHSDHLQGLESLRSPFIYCSSGTRELLLRLEKYPHRMNFTKGILETRRVHYKHLNSLLKSIPLQTPTEIELSPSRTIRVTLFDANHCSGAVMFLIDDSKKAILYTGDIRAESWWVNSLVRNPILLPYTLGERRLDNLYLDTTFAVNRDRYRTFLSKAEGLTELLKKVSAYPEETVFHFNAWTFGYEEVWQALASALKSRIHVDRYKMRLYRSLSSSASGGITTQEAAALCGFKCGNRHQEGCLTDDESVRIHSCERGTGCAALADPYVVSIIPILTRAKDESDVEELGVGGGGGDLSQIHELDLGDTTAAVELIKLCSESIVDQKVRTETLTLITRALGSDSKRLVFEASGSLLDGEDVPLLDVINLLQRVAIKNSADGRTNAAFPSSNAIPNGRVRRKYSKTAQLLPKVIKFPYSRHSSYDELCHLVRSLKPKDIYPCTIDESTWNLDVSIETLFGHLYSSRNFSHDRTMITLSEQRHTITSKSHNTELLEAEDGELESTQRTESTREEKSQDASSSLPTSTTPVRHSNGGLHTDHLQSKKRRLSNTFTPSSRPNLSIQSPSTDTSDSFSMHRHVQAIREEFEEGLRQRSLITGAQTRTAVSLTTACSLPKEGNGVDIEIIAKQNSIQHSIPTPPDEIAYKHTEFWLKRSSTTLSGTPADSMILSGCPKDENEVDDITLRDISNPTVRKEISKLAAILRCSIIMARTWFESLALAHASELSARDLFKHQVRIANDRTNGKRMDDEPKFKKLAGKIRRLRRILPVADEETCFSSLNRCKGDFSKSRDLLAQSLVALAKKAKQPLSEESDGLDEVSQLSLPDASFDSQLTTKLDPVRSESKIEQRKEAYKAARGIYGRQWASHSGILRDLSFQEEEIELG